jgi:deazaflavin-dependent oxidoreductase (nitroreductase family)
MLFGQEHVAKYRESGGAIGHEWQPGVFTLLLTTTGRKSGRRTTTPLIYGRDGDDYVVVASKGGADEHPLWYRNLEVHPDVQIQVGGDVMAAVARTASGEERSRLWSLMTAIWPDYDQYATRTEREIPVVVLTPRAR